MKKTKASVYLDFEQHNNEHRVFWQTSKKRNGVKIPSVLVQDIRDIIPINTPPSDSSQTDATIQGTLPLTNTSPNTPETTLAPGCTDSVHEATAPSEDNETCELKSQVPPDQPIHNCRSIIRYWYPSRGQGASPRFSLPICTSVLQAHLRGVGAYCNCQHCIHEEPYQSPMFTIDENRQLHVNGDNVDLSRLISTQPYTILWLQGSQDHFRRGDSDSHRFAAHDEDHFYVTPLDLPAFQDCLNPLRAVSSLSKICVCDRESAMAVVVAKAAIAVFSSRQST